MKNSIVKILLIGLLVSVIVAISVVGAAFYFIFGAVK